MKILLNHLDPCFSFGLTQTVRMVASYGLELPQLTKDATLHMTVESLPLRSPHKHYLTFLVQDVIITDQHHYQYVLRLDYVTKNDNPKCLNSFTWFDFPFLVQSSVFSLIESKQLDSSSEYDVQKTTSTKILHNVLFVPSHWWAVP
jgi:hypothetical protein